MPFTCYFSLMSNVQVKHLPDDMHEQLRERAAEAGATISDYVLDLIRRDLRRPSRRQWIAQVMNTPKLDLPRSEVVKALDEGRHERDDELSNRAR